MRTHSAAADLEIDLEGLSEGRRDVIHGMYVRYGDALLQEARRRIGPAEAEAVVHEVFVELLRNRTLREQFQGGAVLAWLRQITHYKSLEHLRQAGRYVGGDPPEIGVSLADDIEARHLLSRFLAAAVPAEQREFFGLRFLQCRTQVEIAATLGIPRSTLEGWEHRLTQKLRAFALKGTA